MLQRMFQRRFDVTLLFAVSYVLFSLLRLATKIIDYF